MTAAGAHREGLWIIGRRVERPEAIVLALVLAAWSCTAGSRPRSGWSNAGELAIGGTARLGHGPVRSRFGFARYATLAGRPLR
jgi:hypothetical protein